MSTSFMHVNDEKCQLIEVTLWKTAFLIYVFPPPVYGFSGSCYCLKFFNLNANWKFSIKCLERCGGGFRYRTKYIHLQAWIFFHHFKKARRFRCSSSTPNVLFDFYCLVTTLSVYRIVPDLEYSRCLQTVNGKLSGRNIQWKSAFQQNSPCWRDWRVRKRFLNAFSSWNHLKRNLTQASSV